MNLYVSVTYLYNMICVLNVPNVKYNNRGENYMPNIIVSK